MSISLFLATFLGLGAPDRGRDCDRTDEETVIVETKSEARLEHLLRQVRARVTSLEVEGETLLATEHVHRLHFDQAINEDTFDHLAEVGAVETIERETILSGLELPLDSVLSGQWALGDGSFGDAGINVLPVWADGVQGSRDVVVAVIDTGVDVRHPDLAHALWTGTFRGETVHGWNFVAGSADVQDDHGHGTSVAGVIAAQANGYGIAGVAPKISLMILKAGDRYNRFAMSRFVDAIDFAVDHGANVIHASVGGRHAMPPRQLGQAIERALDRGILFVTAAGNSPNINNDVNECPIYPASFRFENLMSVASTDRRGFLSAFSSWGGHTVHLTAPGEEVLTAALGGGLNKPSGTSLAAPHVSGVAGLLLSARPTEDFRDVKDRILSSATKEPTARIYTVAGGRLNAHAALTWSRPREGPTAWRTLPLRAELRARLSCKSPEARRYRFTAPSAEQIRLRFSRVDVCPSASLEIFDDSGRRLELIRETHVDVGTQAANGSAIRMVLSWSKGRRCCGDLVVKACELTGGTKSGEFCDVAEE